MKKLFFAAILLALTASGIVAQTIENSSRKTIGYISSSGTVENSGRSTIGYIWENGTVENSSRSTIGYAKGVKMEHAAAFFFFFFKSKD